MTDNKSKDSSQDVDLREKYDQAEDFFERNKRQITTIAAVIIIIGGGIFAYNKYFIEGNRNEANNSIWRAEEAFKKDSFNLATEGDEFIGLNYIADEYSSSKTGNRAAYLAGIAALNQKEYDIAINHLEQVNLNDRMVGPAASMALGDAYLEEQKSDEAIKNYERAIVDSDNKFITPIALKKLGLVYIRQKNYTKALKQFERLDRDYSSVTEGRDAKKYIALIKGSM